MSVKAAISRERAELMSATGLTAGVLVGPTLLVSASEAPANNLYGVVATLVAGVGDTLDLDIETSFDRVNWSPVGSFTQLAASGVQNIRFTSFPLAIYVRITATVAGTGSWDFESWMTGVDAEQI